MMMSFIEILKKITNDFGNIPPKNALENIINELDEGHTYIRRLYYDKDNFDKLLKFKFFKNNIDVDKNNRIINKPFSISLNILNKEKTPGKKVAIPHSGHQARLIIYHALCPELENFVLLTIWPDSKSSTDIWNLILKTINDDVVLQLSEKCGLALPNIINPGNDRNACVYKNVNNFIYDWRYAYYILDDGLTIMSHNSPINFRYIMLDEKIKNESWADIRTTIGKISSISSNSITITAPILVEWENSKKIELKIPKKLCDQISCNNLYFLQVYKITGQNNIESHVQRISSAKLEDIIITMLSHSLYLIFLGVSRLKLMNKKQFDELFELCYNKVLDYYFKEFQKVPIDHDVCKSQQLKHIMRYTKWINNYLYIIPPLLNNLIKNYDLELTEFVIVKYDESLYQNQQINIDDIPYNKHGNRLFTRSELFKIKKLYPYMKLQLNTKKLILQIGKYSNAQHNRNVEILWLLKKLNISNSIINHME